MCNHDVSLSSGKGTSSENIFILASSELYSGNSGNACYHSVQSLLSSRLLSKNLKIRTYKTIILPVVL
jgi:hypothetical protein